eukprot:1498599-Rhodomonas_salina.1
MLPANKTAVQQQDELRAACALVAQHAHQNKSKHKKPDGTSADLDAERTSASTHGSRRPAHAPTLPLMPSGELAAPTQSAVLSPAMNPNSMSIDLSSEGFSAATYAALQRMTEHPEYTATPEVDAVDF